MNKKELADTMTIVMDSDINLSEVDLTCFMGFALKVFSPIHTTKKAVAALIRYQCLQLNGELDGEELASICHHAKQKFIVVG